MTDQKDSPAEFEEKEFQHRFTYATNESGWDRLKSVFTRNEYGEKSPEIDFIMKTLWSSGFCGGVTGALLGGQQAKESFIRNNQETVYTHEYLAKRKYIDKMVVEMAKNGFSWSWRLMLFTGSLVTITTALAVHKNALSVHHFTIAGAITGGLFRIRLGLRGGFAASILGGALGTGAGLMIVGAMWATGTSLAEMRYWHYNHWQKEIRLKQEELRIKRMLRAAEKENDEILKQHLLDKKEDTKL